MTPCGESEAMLLCASVFPQQDALLRLNTTGEFLPPAWLIFTPKYD